MNRISKIRFCLQIIVLFFIMIFCTNSYVSAQSNLFNKYGLLVIKDINILQKEIVLDPNKQMVDLQKVIPGLMLDLKYAATNNFTHQKLYPPASTTFLRKPAADALIMVINDLKKLIKLVV